MFDDLYLREEVIEVILNGVIIEAYLEDPKGKSALICCNIVSGRTIHVVCAPKNEYMAIITAYIPSFDKFENNLKIRRK